MNTMNWSWAGLFALGAFHGVNPGMGWLFAVALGMQERRRAAVGRAMLPLALGHALAIAGGVGVAMLVGAVVPLPALQWAVGGALLLVGARRLYRHGHPRWVGMRVGFRDLTLWSFLMASAHGASLMVLPFVLSRAAVPLEHQHHMMAAGSAGIWPAVWGTLIHSAGYLSATAIVGLVVFERFGVGLLRKAWINLDLVWAAALVITSAAVVMSAMGR